MAFYQEQRVQFAKNISALKADLTNALYESMSYRSRDDDLTLTGSAALYMQGWPRLPQDIDFSVWNAQVFNLFSSQLMSYPPHIGVISLSATSHRLESQGQVIDIILAGPLYEPYTLTVADICAESYQHVMLRKLKDRVGPLTIHDWLDCLFLSTKDYPCFKEILCSLVPSRRRAIYDLTMQRKNLEVAPQLSIDGYNITPNDVENFSTLLSNLL